MGQDLQGVWTGTDLDLHINILELKTVLIALKHFQKLIVGKVVLILSDNSSTVSYIAKQGGTKVWLMYLLAWQIFALTRRLEVTLQVRHIPGCLNVIADRLSRKGQIQQTEWSLNPLVFKQICQARSTPNLDLFATHENAKLPVYVSPVPDPQAWAVDAMSISWKGMDAYAYPPNKIVNISSDKSNGSTMPTAIGGSSVASTKLVPPSNSIVNRSTSGIAKNKESAKAAKKSGVRSKSGDAKLASLDDRYLNLVKKGFSQSLAQRISAPQRPSTRKNYDARVRLFLGWCEDNEVDGRKPSIMDIAEFFEYRFVTKGKAPGTIQGYKTAVTDHYSKEIVDIGGSEELSRILRSYYKERPPVLNKLIPWDLGLVLQVLRGAPFEPLGAASLKHLTFKTIFLIALASGKRRSELHALSHESVRRLKRKGPQVEAFAIKTIPGFLPKNLGEIDTLLADREIVIPSLSDYVGADLKEDRLNCPVRALKFYLDKTSHFREGKKLLFISYEPNWNKDICSQTVSSYLKTVVTDCYKFYNKNRKVYEAEQILKGNVKAHQVRATSASWAAYGGVSMRQIMDACFWKSNNTFTSFYFKDHWVQQNGVFSIGPVVAAGAVVDGKKNKNS